MREYENEEGAGMQGEACRYAGITHKWGRVPIEQVWDQVPKSGCRSAWAQHNHIHMGHGVYSPMGKVHESHNDAGLADAEIGKWEAG